MKKLLAAMVTGILVYGSAFAQTTNLKTESAKTGQVCKSSGSGKTCYATNNAENYKVCKSKKGYYTCGKKPSEAGISGAKNQNKATSYVVTGNTKNSPAEKTSKVCKPTKNGAKECYNTTYNENFTVCKNYQGYYICGEKANNYNSTFELFPFMNPAVEYQNTYENKSGLAPENQSYKNMENPVK